MFKKFVFQLSLFFLILTHCLAKQQVIKLPQPIYKSTTSVEQAIYRRKSCRRFKNVKLTKSQISQLLWSVGGTNIDGITSATRVYPSAGGIYPLEIYLLCGDVADLPKGIYKYDWKNHALTLITVGDLRSQLAKVCYYQNFISEAPISIIWTAVVEKTTARYGTRGKERYICIDLGHSAQNLYLQCETLGLGTVAVGAFDDTEVAKLLSLPQNEVPLYIMPVGYPK